MKLLPSLVVALLLSELAMRPAAAQVSINQAALDQLSGVQPASMTVPAPVHHVVHHVSKPSPALVPLVAKPAQPVPAPPSLPTAPPPLPVLNPPPSTAKPAPPAPTPVQPAAMKAPPPPVPKAAPLPAAQLQFAADSSTLPTNAAAILKPICAGAGTSGTVSIAASAPVDPSDRSSAMRLSMSRAFAVRDALVACGVPATHILPQAMGAAPGKDPNSTMVNLQK